MSHNVGSTDSPRRLWQVAAAFALGHVVMLFIGLSQQSPASLSEGVSGVEEAYGGADITAMYIGGTVELLGFLCLLVAMVFLARAIGRQTEAGRWAAQTGLMAGVGYVAVTFATGLPAGAAAIYGAQHGLDYETAFAINNIRNFAYFVSLMLLGAHALCLAVSAFSDRFSTRWIGIGGFVAGIALLAAPALASAGLQDWTTLLWLVWWTGVAVILFRHEPRTAADQPGTVTEPATMRHS